MKAHSLSVNIDTVTKLCALMRHWILRSTSNAGSGHPTSSLSATELMAGLLFGGTFRYDVENPKHPNNDRLIFSKGHASPLFYSLWLAAGQVTGKEIMTYRVFQSVFEGHPTPRFRFTEAATGSLGQGLSIGVGIAMAAKYLDKLPYRAYVLLGDSEMAEGSQWEAIQVAAHYELNNLVGILDVNRLGQRGETMYGWDTDAYRLRIEAFGWETISIDGHDLPQVIDAYRQAAEAKRPTMIIARTIKGKGVSFVENKDGWHGKALDEDQLKRALKEIGDVDAGLRGSIEKPQDQAPQVPEAGHAGHLAYKKGDLIATRDAYGKGLQRIYPAYPRIVSLDGEVSNSTRAEMFKDAHPDRFFEMYIAEQNMACVALGMATRGAIPFASSFAAFLTRAFDQIRMSQYSRANLKFVGSHAGVSIGQDGPSQMALEDIAMFRSLAESVVLHPSDAVSADKLIEQAARYEGIVYLRTARNKTPVIYDNDEEFPIGGSKVLRRGDKDRATLVAAGVTVHEALAAYEELSRSDIPVRVIDLYSIKPLDEGTLQAAARETGHIITVEDHYAAGGVGEAVAAALGREKAQVEIMAVRRLPLSGKPQELLDYVGISRKAIVEKVMSL